MTVRVSVFYMFQFPAPHFCVSAQPWISCISAGSTQLWFTCVVRNPSQSSSSKSTQSFSSFPPAPWLFLNVLHLAVQGSWPLDLPVSVSVLGSRSCRSSSFLHALDSISSFWPFSSGLAPCSSAPPGSVSCWTSLGSFISLALPQTSTPLAVPCPSNPFALSASLTSGFTLVFGCTVYTQACQAPISTLVQWACSSKHGPPGLQCHLGTSSSWLCLGLCLLWLRLSLLCHWFCLVGLHCDSSLPWLHCGFASWLLLLEFRPDSSSFLFALASPVSASTLAFTSFFSTLSSPFLISTLASDSTLAPPSIISSVVVPSVMPLSSSGSSTS